MALPAPIQAAIDRLRTFYNGSIWVPTGSDGVANPGGFDGDGHAVNFVPALRDVAIVGMAIGETADASAGSASAAAASAGAAASSAQAASASADRAATWDPTNYATKASPTFTGDPKAPTPAYGDSDTSIATTAFVQRAATNRAFKTNLHYGS